MSTGEVTSLSARRARDYAAEAAQLREQLEDARRALAIVDAIRDGVDLAAGERPCACGMYACLRCVADMLCAAISPKGTR